MRKSLTRLAERALDLAVDLEADEVGIDVRAEVFELRAHVHALLAKQLVNRSVERLAVFSSLLGEAADRSEQGGSVVDLLEEAEFELEQVADDLAVAAREV